MKYKGYTGCVEVDEEAGILFGRVVDIRDVITFQGMTVQEARQAFHDSVDDYLAFCQQLGEEPAKPFSGKLPFRTSPERHRKIYLAATMAGKSVNAWMDDTLAEAAEKELHEPVS
jgi:predicted HicB family RNase H-like nuclease